MHSNEHPSKPVIAPVIAIVGPTATGKTALSVELAHWLTTEIVSADSQVIYRELNIGTAKPTVEERQGIAHHMIDVAAPDEAYSAANYQAQATSHLQAIGTAGKIPIVVGGTGFYARALLQADFIPDVPPNPEFRQAMADLAEREGPHALHARLRALDPERADALHPNDRVRVIRALEIIEATGQPVPKQSREKALQVLWFGLMFEDRDLLRRRIDQRIELMLQAGWLAEVETLVERYGSQAHALGVAHGYPELVQVVLGQRSLADAVEQIRINIHQYARRQMTWFRRNPDIFWLPCDQWTPDELRNAVKRRITESGYGPG
jgi:tRNA dimethylallyltransferase